MTTKITERTIKAAIDTGYRRLENINRQIKEVYSNMATDEELMQAAAFPGKADNGMHGDIDCVYRQYLKLKEQQQTELAEYTDGLLEEQQTILKILKCYNALSEAEHKILEYLYSDSRNVKEGLVMAMQEEHISRATVFRIRKRAVDSIIKMYTSESDTDD